MNISVTKIRTVLYNYFADQIIDDEELEDTIDGIIAELTDDDEEQVEDLEA